MKNSFKQHPILIFGCRRSGTTLLRSMLERHPDLLAHPKEPQFILTLLSQFGYTLHRKEKAVSALIQHPYLPEGLDRSELAAFLSDPAIQTWSDLIKAYLVYWSKDQVNDKPIVLKDPAFTFHLESLHKLFPEARYIHVVRHPYGNVSSQRARWQDASLWECAVWWKEAVTIGYQFSRSQPERCFEIDYQTLVLEPEMTLKQTCEFLGIPFTEKMLNFTLDTISFSPDKPPQGKRFTELDPKRLDRWRKYLTPIDICLIEHCCGQEMRWWQYEMLSPFVNHEVLRRRLLRERTSYSLLKVVRSLKQKLRQLKYRITL